MAEYSQWLPQSKSDRGFNACAEDSQDHLKIGWERTLWTKLFTTWQIVRQDTCRDGSLEVIHKTQCFSCKHNDIIIINNDK